MKCHTPARLSLEAGGAIVAGSGGFTRSVPTQRGAVYEARTDAAAGVNVYACAGQETPVTGGVPFCREAPLTFLADDFVVFRAAAGTRLFLRQVTA